MLFDPSISIGAILNAIALLVGFTIAFTRIGGRIDLMAQRLQAVEEAVKQIAANDIRMATIEERLNNQVKMLVTAQNEIASMRRGEGFITHRRTAADGETAY